MKGILPILEPGAAGWKARGLPLYTDCESFLHFRAMAFLKLCNDVDGTAVRDGTHELLVCSLEFFHALVIFHY